jgi:1-acyl-sn-glycerol-3-phosphate acyltransferase
MNLNESLPIKITTDGSQWAKLLLKLLGWNLIVPGLPGNHGIIVAYPHTSNLDFFIGMIAKSACGIKANFLAKDSLFKIPLVGWWLRYLGGRPVIRNSPQGYVKDLAQEMAKAPFFWLAITPEGTRKKTPGWRSGFYHLALETHYPVGFVYLDYQKKTIGLTDFLTMTGNEEADFVKIREIYQGKLGFYPENMSPITLWSPQKDKNKV